MQRKDIKLNDAYKKIGKPIKDILPNEVKQMNIRESIPMKFPEASEPQFTTPIIPNTPFEEWPGDDTALSFDFGVQSNTLFTDNLNHLIIFPYSLRNDTIRNIIWLRPHEYIHKILTRQETDTGKVNILTLSNNLENSNHRKSIQRLERRNTLNHITNSEINEYLSKRREINDKLSDEKLQHLQLFIVKHKEIMMTEPQETLENKPRLEKRGSIKERVSIKLTQSPLDNNNMINTYYEPDPSNIYMNRYYCKYSKWLASIYQVIKDQNIHNVINPKEKTIPMKIYPQENGIPIYNPSGRYWVKLYHMGKYRKVEIDDYIPLNRNYELLFPQCEDIKELWPILITKALMKLYSYKHRNFSYDQMEVGDCSPIYSLTGYICTNIPANVLFDSFAKNPNDNLLKRILSDENYKTKEKMIIAFKKEEKLKNKTVDIESSNNIFTFDNYKEDEKKMCNNKLPVSTSLKMPLINRDLRNNMQRIGTTHIKPEVLSHLNIVKKKNRKQANGIYYDIAYSLIELFSSQQFNLRCLFPLVFSDLKLHFNVKYKQMPPEEKKMYIEQLKALRTLQKTEKERRINEWKAPGQNSFLIKIANSAIDKDSHSLSDIKTEYTSIQIEIIKKCLLNSLKYPPIDYFLPTFLNQVFKDEESGEINFWTMRFYSKFLQREGQIEHEDTPYIIPSVRNEGKWLSYSQLTESFSHFIVMTNPSLYKNKLIIDNIWYNYNTDLFEENDSTRMIRLKADISSLNTKGNIIMLFEPNGEKNYKSNSSQLPQYGNGMEGQKKQNQFDDITYSLNLQLYQISNDTNNKTDFIKMNSVSLSNSLCSTEISDLDNSKEYFLNIKGGIIPFGYIVHMYSNNLQMIPYSYQQFLIEYKGFTSKKIQLSHPCLEKGKYYLLSRIKLFNKGNEGLTAKFYTLFIGYDNKNIRENIEVFLINSITNKKKRICQKEVFNVSFLKDETYLIELSIVPPFNIKDTSFEYEIVCSNKGDIYIEGIDMIHPTELQDMFLPNKHAVVFKELLYSTELSIASLEIEMIYHPTIIPENNNDEDDGINREEITTKNEEDDKSVSNAIQTKKGEDIRMIVEFHENDKMIFSKSFINKTVIRNLVLKRKDLNPKNTQDLIQYQLYCYLDITECPKCLLKASEYQSDYFWHIRLFASDTVCFVRNTIKEDKERDIIRGWEVNQIGRGEKAKLARHKYLIIKQTEQEPKGSRPPAVIESNSDMIITNIPPSSNDNPFKDFNTPLPTIDSYNSLFMKNFYIYATRDRVIINNTSSSSSISKRTKSSDPFPKIQSQYCRSKEDYKRERDNIIEKYDHYYQLHTEANNEYESRKRLFSNDIETINEKRYTHRQDKNSRNKNKYQAMITEAMTNEVEFEKQMELLEEMVNNDREQRKDFNFGPAYNQLKSTLNVKRVKMNRQSKLNEAVRIMSLKKEEIIRNDLVNCMKKNNNSNKEEIVEKHLSDLNDNILHISSDLVKQLKNIQSH